MDKFIRETLASKDDLSKEESRQALGKMVGHDEKLILLSQRKAYQWQSWGKCIEPCYTNMDSPVVSQQESECMTNCMAKALETMEHFHLQYSRLVRQ
jgi:Tim10/DDP family zinc finger